MALVLLGFYLYSQNGSTRQMPQLQTKLLLGSIKGAFFHGIGHLYNGTMDSTGFDLRFQPKNMAQSLLSQVVVVVGLSGIFKGTMPGASMKQILGTAIAGAIGLTVLGVLPILNFVYLQAVIYVTSSIYFLFCLKQQPDGTNPKHTAVYMLHAYFQLPVLCIGVLESTKCQEHLDAFGGHALFDTTISLGQIAIQLLTTQLELSLLDKEASAKKKVL